MTSQEDLLASLLEKVSSQMAADLKEAIVAAVEKELSRTLNKALLEGEFYRRVNDDLQESLKNIYKEIKTAKQGKPLPVLGDPDELINKASDQLDAVLRTTEKAAEEIIEIVERLQELQSSLGGVIKALDSGGITKEQREQLSRINETLGSDLLRIMTTLSFQDLTGQRIKIIIETIKKIEAIVLDVYMSTGLMIQAREQTPEKDFEQIEAEAKDKVSSTLKGPQEGSDQGAVDGLLAQLGLD
jgi:chemotaxis protein CheZ